MVMNHDLEYPFSIFIFEILTLAFAEEEKRELIDNRIPKSACYGKVYGFQYRRTFQLI